MLTSLQLIDRLPLLQHIHPLGPAPYPLRVQSVAHFPRHRRAADGPRDPPRTYHHPLCRSHPSTKATGARRRHSRRRHRRPGFDRWHHHRHMRVHLPAPARTAPKRPKRRRGSSPLPPAAAAAAAAAATSAAARATAAAAAAGNDAAAAAATAADIFCAGARRFCRGRTAAPATAAAAAAAAAGRGQVHWPNTAARRKYGAC